jgi:hypothetical protein
MKTLICRWFLQFSHERNTTASTCLTHKTTPLRPASKSRRSRGACGRNPPVRINRARGRARAASNYSLASRFHFFPVLICAVSWSATLNQCGFGEGFIGVMLDWKLDGAAFDRLVPGCCSDLWSFGSMHWS